jgi:hypothetical protein
MSKPVRLAREARAELREAARRYREQRPELRIEDQEAADAHVGASLRKSVALIGGGSTTIERVLSDTHRHGRSATCTRARRGPASDANPLDRLVSKHLKQTGTSRLFERY